MKTVVRKLNHATVNHVKKKITAANNFYVIKNQQKRKEQRATIFPVDAEFNSD